MRVLISCLWFFRLVYLRIHSLYDSLLKHATLYHMHVGSTRRVGLLVNVFRFTKRALALNAAHIHSLFLSLLSFSALLSLSPTPHQYQAIGAAGAAAILAQPGVPAKVGTCVFDEECQHVCKYKWCALVAHHYVSLRVVVKGVCLTPVN